MLDIKVISQLLVQDPPLTLFRSNRHKDPMCIPLSAGKTSADISWKPALGERLGKQTVLLRTAGETVQELLNLLTKILHILEKRNSCTKLALSLRPKRKGKLADLEERQGTLLTFNTD